MPETPLQPEWVSLAKSQLNKPYIWGSGSGAGGRGTGDIDPKTGLPKGFDCSGYVAWVLKEGMGVDLPAYTGTAYQKTAAVSKDEAQPGDIVFWNMDNPDPAIQHMAIYLGDGKVIQAGGTSRTVNIADVNSIGTPEFRRPAGTGASTARKEMEQVLPQPGTKEYTAQLQDQLFGPDPAAAQAQPRPPAASSGGTSVPENGQILRGDLLTVEDFQALVEAHGGVRSSTPIFGAAGGGTAADRIFDEDGGQSVGANPTFDYVFNDGTTVRLRHGMGEGRAFIQVANEPKFPAQATRGGDLSEFQPIVNPNTGKPTALYNPRTGQTINLPEGASPSKPERFTHEGNVYSWTGEGMPQLLLAATPKPAPQPETRVVGNQVVRINPDGSFGGVVYSAPQGWTLRTDEQTGEIIAINPQTLDLRVVREGKEQPPRQVTAGLDNRELLYEDRATGQLSTQANPLYSPEAVRQQQDLYDSIGHIQGMLERKEMTPVEATAYVQALQQNYLASLRGTTPFQEAQQRAKERQEQATLGKDLLNQRISSGMPVVNQALSTFRDVTQNLRTPVPSLAGFNPVQFAESAVNRLGGAQTGTIGQQLLAGALPEPPQPGAMETGLANLGNPGRMPEGQRLQILALLQAAQNGGANAPV